VREKEIFEKVDFSKAEGNEKIGLLIYDCHKWLKLKLEEEI